MPASYMSPAPMFSALSAPATSCAVFPSSAKKIRQMPVSPSGSGIARNWMPGRSAIPSLLAVRLHPVVVTPCSANRFSRAIMLPNRGVASGHSAQTVKDLATSEVVRYHVGDVYGEPTIRPLDLCQPPHDALYRLCIAG